MGDRSFFQKSQLGYVRDRGYIADAIGDSKMGEVGQVPNDGWMGVIMVGQLKMGDFFEEQRDAIRSGDHQMDVVQN